MSRFESTIAWGVTAAAVGNFFGVCLATHSPGSDIEWLSFLWLGVLFAQASFHSLLTALLDWPLPSRVFGAVVTGGTILLGLAGGLTADGLHVAELAEISAAVPAIALAAQSPFWLLRFVGGYRIASPIYTPPAERERPWGIKHFFGATVTVAVVLGMLRLTGEPMDEVIVPVGIASCFMAMFGALNVLPTIVCVLRIEHGARARDCGIMVQLLWLVMLLLPVGAVTNRFTRGEAFEFVLLFSVAFAATLIGLLVWLRSLGFRLYLGRESVAAQSEAK